MSKLREYSWVLGFVVAAALSFAGALTTNRFLAEKLQAPEKVEGLPPPGAGGDRSPGTRIASAPLEQLEDGGSGDTFPGQPTFTESTSFRPTKPPLRDYEVILIRNLFDSENSLRFPEFATTDDGTETVANTGGDLSIRLFGTVVANPHQFSWAIISKDESNAPQEIFKVEDDIYGEGTLRRVRRNQVVVALADGSEVTIDLYTGQGNDTSRAVARDDNEKSEDELGGSIRKLGENRYEIDNSEIQSAMSNIDQLARDARIVPNFKDGNTVGFKVFRIKPNSLYKKLGLRNGDVINSINGFEINSTEKALQLYQMLRTEKNINLEVSRRGQPMTLEYLIR